MGSAALGTADTHPLGQEPLPMVGVRVSVALRDRIRSAAEQEGLTMSALIRRTLEQSHLIQEVNSG